MSKIKFTANLLDNINDNIIMFSLKDFCVQNVKIFLSKLKKYQIKMNKQKDLDITIEYHYKKRTLNQNDLMWALYQIEANEMNGGIPGHSEQEVTTIELYLTDLIQHGEREIITTAKKNLQYYKNEYRIITEIDYLNQVFFVDNFPSSDIPDDAKIRLKTVRGTSKFNKKDMARWIDRIFNRLAHSGISVTTPGEIEKYWLDWRKFLNKKKIILHSEKYITQAEYIENNPICEACGKYIAQGAGEIAHIKSVGMGRDRKTIEDSSANWLRLHAYPCHRKHWHEWGIEQFMKQYSHLENKIKLALKQGEENE